MRPAGSPTLLSHLKLSSATGLLRRQSEAARIEVMTGRKNDLQRILGGSASRAHLIKSAFDGINVNRSAIDSALLRGSIAQSALSAIAQGASQTNADIAAALGRGDEASISLSSNEARVRLESAFSRLNVRIGGLSVFAGDGADRNALGDVNQLISDISAIYSGSADAVQFESNLDTYFNDPLGGFSTTIYTGGAGDLGALEIAPGEKALAATKADAQGVKDLLRGFAVIAVAGSLPQSAIRDAALGEAGMKLLNGSDAIAELRASIGIDESRAAQAKDLLDVEETIFAEEYNNLTAADPFEAASRLQSLEAQTEAAYVLTSRISRLSLVNFL